MARLTQISPEASAGRSRELLEAVKARLRRWENRLQVVYRPLWTVEQLVAHATEQAGRSPLGGILADYLQRIAPPRGRHERRDIEVSADEIFYTNLAFRTGSRKFYNILAAGMKPEKAFGTNETVWSFGYGLGTVAGNVLAATRE